jgi:uncharacterized membrane protein
MLICQTPILFGNRSEWIIESSVAGFIIVVIYTIFSTERALIKLEKENQKN